ncbi:MAG: hypothetical protein IJ684_05265 [Bacteroidales bacterium]|nr:hypothetical protein [Bacteroidales bacterium]
MATRDGSGARDIVVGRRCCAEGSCSRRTGEGRWRLRPKQASQARL